ncbi:MAG: biotin carboxylase [Bacteroidetes bacterium QH_2_64_74]|nr:MAG: biotin carboxylase [Bacteroidetes bacterium QH_2_64_74]
MTDSSVSSRPIQNVLVANRGEIAVRVLRTCHERGLRTVAVYSTPDRTAPHVRRADEAHHIGPAAASASYLDQGAILEAAHRSGADAIHPGYGFLSENADFAEACADAGVHFVGPPPEAIRAMGDKTAARQLMEEAGVPMAPGTTDAVTSTEEGERIADGIGYPVLIKAAAGGGGKGMRIVHEPGTFAGAMDRAQGEAESSFGDGRVFLEKYIEEPRHIEFQILADHHGHTVHLFERECSIQRRHQKVIEEAPSSILTPEVRREMGEAAVAAAESCGYRNAGTVEFLVDKDLNYYFMEMNTRLQVEHPVTEWVTGVDLVAEQLRVAQGEELGYTTDDLSIDGHAVESRVGGEVLIHYDPMISKLTTWGPDRTAAIDRMIRALDEYEVASMATTIPFCRFAMQHEGFRAGDFTTHFVEEEFDPSVLHVDDPERDELAALAATLYDRHTQEDKAPQITARSDGQDGLSPWRRRRRHAS